MDDDCDTDDVSVTSTVAAPEGNYEVECILAEKWDVWLDGQPDEPPFRGIKYLTKWDGYALHESTWEPKTSFNPPDEYGNVLSGTPIVLQQWYNKKNSMTGPEFRNYCQKHEDELVEAVEKAEAERLIKLARREKKLQKLTVPKKRARPVVSDKDDDDEPTPSRRSQKRLSPKSTAPPKIAREGYDSMSARHPRRVRKPPIVQSESSLSESDLTEDSMMEELDENKTSHESTGAKGTTEISKPRLRSVQSNCTPSKPAATATNSDSAARPSRNRSGSTKAPQTSLKSPADVDPQVTNPQKDGAATNADGSPDRTDTRPLASARRKSIADGSMRSFASVSSERSAAPTSTVGIKIVNQPKTQFRSEWKNGKNQFSTLHYRAVAQKRSRNEGTPDPAALEIVNDPFSNVSSKARATDDVPYNTSANHGGLSEGSSDTPLEPWEVDKVPLVCASWRLSNNCPKSAQNCFFLHRNKGPNGKVYPVGDPAGRIPHKYRKPPLTCGHWLYKPNGCYKSDEQCDFAHRNTGWILDESKSNGKATQINRDLRPQSENAQGTAPKSPGIPRKKSMPRHKLTCWYWANGTCRNKPEACSFQHYHTGIVADGPLANGIQQSYHFAVEQTGDSPLLATDVSVDLETNPVTGPQANAGSMCPPQHVPNQTPPNDFFTPPPPPHPPLKFPLPEATCEKLRRRIHSVCGLDFQEMFTRNDSKGSTTLADRRVFLVFHPEQHSEELELITRWLLMHHVQIFGTHYQGAWSVFQQQIKRGGSGVVIVHPDFEYFTELPGLGQILRCQIRIWSVGLQEGIEYDPALSNAPPVCRYAPIEVFPVGGFIYITDEVLEQEPQLALRIIELFFEKIARLKQLEGPLSPGRQVDDASLLWRICVRPELMEHLIQHCEKHQDKLEAGNADTQSRAQLYRILAETNYIEQDEPSEPLSLVPDKFPILSERRIIADCEPVDYFNTLARSQEDANTNMIRYYAGLQVDMRRDYRHFFIVHTEPTAPCVQRWKQEMQTIAGVLTPEECAQELSKSSEDSMFDFCERFMPEKRVKEGSGG